ncbi:hypothetical protein AB0C90_09620 [Streptomyces sp. NPDC048550]|uniref:hypothetical protein n=1 Tax=unclassified Streptomyces TaxID=2593676 RepID=UPI002E158F8F|nr:hypothetical protein OG299_35710 [Streptomyces sp. NBC_01296]WSW57842.1 hypothetical protein OG513_04215 [Streptomyces sp. NBC_00998]
MTTTRSTLATTARHRAAPDDGGRPPYVPTARQPAHAATAAPLFEQLAREWAARGATVPGRPDPAWRRLVSWEHFERETAATVRDLHLRGPEPAPEPVSPGNPPRWKRA